MVVWVHRRKSCCGDDEAAHRIGLGGEKGLGTVEKWTTDHLVFTFDAADSTSRVQWTQVGAEISSHDSQNLKRFAQHGGCLEQGGYTNNWKIRHARLWQMNGDPWVVVRKSVPRRQPPHTSVKQVLDQTCAPVTEPLNSRIETDLMAKLRVYRLELSPCVVRCQYQQTCV